MDAARVCVLTHPSSSSSEGEEEEEEQLLEGASSLPESSFSSSSSVLRSISCSISGTEVQLMVGLQTWEVGLLN